jgi:hypothetical protein
MKTLRNVVGVLAVLASPLLLAQTSTPVRSAEMPLRTSFRGTDSAEPPSAHAQKGPKASLQGSDSRNPHSGTWQQATGSFEDTDTESPNTHS